MSAPKTVLQLVERFERDRDTYENPHFNETETRIQFLNPLFKALGWDIDNTGGRPEIYKDVIHEDALKIGGGTKAPDYCFQVGGARKFFVEAKKPAINIKDDANPAFQLRRYAWSAKLPLSILSNFAELAIYDCRVRPYNDDKAKKARLHYWSCNQYDNTWDEIAEIFSKDAVLKGSLDRLADSTRSKRGSAEVDSEFLSEIEGWRDALAKNFALRNPGLTTRDLNYAVQQSIDRIIFLRICEDRGIEPYGVLQGLLDGNNIYDRLKTLFHSADDRYNSGLFHFRNEKDRTQPPDGLTLKLNVDDKPLKDIFRALYYPTSPYEFSVLPADILGHVYEQFLGKVIRLTDGGHAKVEEKPEVKKAGGVYYTPTYVVNYIVRNTVGRLLDQKQPSELKRLSILDPACGSGSFLLGAYQYLLDWHLEKYTAHEPEQFAKGKRSKIFKSVKKGWRLTTSERKRILLDHIYGVDIDPQAVEVTKLSLLLKVLEDESSENINKNREFFHERALPDLEANIKCGNSLVGPDFYANKFDFDTGFRDDINAFNWNDEFPMQLKAGGFDVVIGNPPYLYSAGKTFADYFTAPNYLLAQYQTDFYVYFIEKALQLATKGGLVSFIVSDSWLNSQYFSKMREHLLKEHRIHLLTIFDYPVFEKVALENSIFVVSKSGKPHTFPVVLFSAPNSHSVLNELEPKHALTTGQINPRTSTANDSILQRLESGSVPLDSLVLVNRGIHAYRTDGYGQSKFGRGTQTERDKDEESYHANKPLNKTYLPELKGKDVHRYYFVPNGRYVSYGPWLAEPRQPEFFMQPKVVLRKILSAKLHGTYIEPPQAIDQSLYILISPKENTQELKYVLGILLSGLGAWYLRTKWAIYDVLYPWYTVKQLSKFPIKKGGKGIVELVDATLALHKKGRKAKTSHDKQLVVRQLANIEARIDQAVYSLYGLGERDIASIEKEQTER